MFGDADQETDFFEEVVESLPNQGSACVQIVNMLPPTQRAEAPENCLRLAA